MGWQEEVPELWGACEGPVVESDERRKENLQACLKLEAVCPSENSVLECRNRAF